MKWAWVVLVMAGCASAPRPLSFKLQRFSSTEFYSVDRDRGSVVLIDIWASWCKPCARAMPKMVALAKRFEDRGVRFVTINVDDDTLGINGFLDAAHVNPPVLLDERGEVTHQELHVSEFPTSMVVDRKGFVRFRHAGLQPETEAELARELETLLAEAP